MSLLADEDVSLAVLSPGVRVAHVALLQRRQVLLETVERRHRQLGAVQVQSAQTLQTFADRIEIEKMASDGFNEFRMDSIRFLTRQVGESFVGDGSFAQIQHLQLVQVFRNQRQTRVAKLQASEHASCHPNCLFLSSLLLRCALHLAST